MYKLTKIDANLEALPDDAQDHQLVRIERDLLARPLYVTSFRSPKRMTRDEAKKWAESLTVHGRPCRLPTVEEAFMIPDRSRTEEPTLDPTFFPDCEGEWIWTDTDDAQPPAGYAWVVGLGGGFSGRSRRGFRDFARAVLAGQ